MKKVKLFSGRGGRPGVRRERGAASSRPPVARMLRIHQLLTEDSFPNCSRLAGVFEVSYKTVQRDIDFMRDQLLLPIDYDQVRRGFHYTKPVAQFPLVSVSQGELVALLVAQRAIEEHRGTVFEKPLRSAFDKLAGSLDAEAAVSLHDLAEAVSFRGLGAPKYELRNFEVLADAVLKATLAEFDYLSLRARAPERRRVEPLHLACIDGQWYLIAHDLVRGARRTFALTRIRRAKDLKKPFRRPKDFSLGGMLEGSFLTFESRGVEEVVMDFDAFAARIVSERKWHKSQKIRAIEGGGVRVTLRVGLAPDLEKWILGWGAHAEVVAPAALRESIATAAENLAAKYRARARRG